MAAVASVVSIVLFLAFLTAGLQKVLFSPAMSHAAEHLGLTKRLYQRIGVIEMVAGVAVMVGLVGKGASLPAILNEVAGAGLVALMIGAVVVHRRRSDAFAAYGPALGLGLLAALEVVFRLFQ